MRRLGQGTAAWFTPWPCRIWNSRPSSVPHASFRHHRIDNSTCQRRQFIALPKLPDLPSLLKPASSSRQYKDRIVVKYSQQEFYDLVADVDQYQQFLPWCTYSKMSAPLLSSDRSGRDEKELGSEPTWQSSGSQLKTPVIVRHGELGIGFNSFQERYVSKVTCQEPWAVRAVSYDSKLFKELSTTWRFAPDIPKSTTLEATMDRELQEKQLLTRVAPSGDAGVDSGDSSLPSTSTLTPSYPREPEQQKQQLEHYFTAAAVFGEAAVPNLKNRQSQATLAPKTTAATGPGLSPLASVPSQHTQPGTDPSGAQLSSSPPESHSFTHTDKQPFPSPPNQVLERTASPSNLATMKPSDYPSCWVDFEIQFEFASPVHASMSSLFFDHVSKEMLRAFINRAEVLYGKR